MRTRFSKMVVLFHADARRLIRLSWIWCRWIPPVNGFVWPMVTTRRKGRGMPRPRNALVFNALSPFGRGRVSEGGGIFSRRWAQIKQIFWNFDDDGSQMPMTSVILCLICGICVSKTIRLRDAKTLTKSPAGGNEKPTLRKWGFWRLFALLFSGLHYCSISYARKMSD